MKTSAASVIVSVAIAVVLWWTCGTLEWVWFKPKMLESYLRRQGIPGTPYTPLVGDIKKDHSTLMKAKSKPIKVTDDIIPRVLPFPSHMLKTYDTENKKTDAEVYPVLNLLSNSRTCIPYTQKILGLEKSEMKLRL
ncbi:unnamed protein product, partial [Brassica oleracea]